MYWERRPLHWNSTLKHPLTKDTLPSVINNEINLYPDLRPNIPFKGPISWLRVMYMPLQHVLGEEILLNASNLKIRHVSYLWIDDSIQRMYLCHSLGPHSCPICFINRHFRFESIQFCTQHIFGERRTFPSLPNLQISLTSHSLAKYSLRWGCIVVQVFIHFPCA